MMPKALLIVTMITVFVAGCAPYSGSARLPRSERQYIETFNPDGTRRSYGYVEGGYIQTFNPDGTRREYGTVKDGHINLYNPNGTRNSYGTVGR